MKLEDNIPNGVRKGAEFDEQSSLRAISCGTTGSLWLEAGRPAMTGSTNWGVRSRAKAPEFNYTWSSPAHAIVWDPNYCPIRV